MLFLYKRLLPHGPNHARIALFTAFIMLFLIGMEAKAEFKPVKRGERPPIDLSNVPEDAYEKGVIRIKFNETAERTLSENEMSRTGEGTITFGVPAVDALNQTYGVFNARKSFDSPALNNRYTERHRKWGFHLWYDLTVDESADIIAMVIDYMGLDEITIAEPHYKKELIGNVPNEWEDYTADTALEHHTREGRGWFPNDPDFDAQWHYHNTGQTNGTPGADISLPEAWTIETGDIQVIVAVVDGGIAINHPDLAGNIWEGVGYNFVSNTPNIVPHNHGSHVAGTIAAVNNNAVGVSGIAGGWGDIPGVSLMSAQVFEPGWGQSGGFHLAPVYAADNGAAISQNSWGYTSTGYYEQAVLDAIDYFNVNGGGDVMDGGLTIFAAGNSSNAGANYPGYYSGAMAVAALNHNDQLAWYSNFGTHIEISAPGGETNTNPIEGVLSPVNVGYDFYQGTSMACPHVSGVVALMLSMAPGEFEVEEIKDMLLSTTDDIYGSNPNYIGLLGTGRVNAFAALSETLFNMADPEAPAAPLNLTVTADPDGELAAELNWTNPVEAAGGETLADLDTIHVFRGDLLIYSILDPVIGEEVSYTDHDIDQDGTYLYVVRGANFAGTGLAATGSAYVGHDVPAAPTDVVLEAAGDNAILSWQAPETGLNNGFFDGNNLSYSIHRNPGNIEVASGITQPVFFDQNIPDVGNYFYSVTAHNHVGEGGTGTSNISTLGAEGLLIYEPFDLPAGELPVGWYIEGPGETNWGVHNSETAGGEAPQMRLNWSPSFTAVSKLITHTVDISDYEQVRLTFRQYLRNYGSVAGQISVNYSLDGEDIWEELMSFDGTVDYGPLLEEFFIDLTDENESIRFAFRWEGNTWNIWDWNIDDVVLEGIGDFYEVTFEVRDEEEMPVQGATVTLDGEHGMEVIPGLYLYTRVEPGLYNVTIEKEGFEPYEGEVEVVDDHISESIVLMHKRFLVTFDVRDQDDASLDGAVITLGEQTNAPGDYVFDEIIGGVYPYFVEKEGYHPVSDTLVVSLEDVIKEVTLDLIVYSVTFEPVDIDGEPIHGAVVVFEGTEHQAGHYILDDIVPGSYDYTVMKENYFPAHGTLEIVNDDVWEQVVLLVDDTSTEDMTDHQLLVYPNPASGKVNVEADVRISKIVLTDIIGNTIKTIGVDAMQTGIDVQHLDTGIYFIRIYMADEDVITRRLQIVR